MAATYYVDRDSTGGGTGTTQALSGADCAYQTLQEFVTARAGTLTESVTVYCCSADAAHTADTTACTVTGFTTTEANYLEIASLPAQRHAGVWSDTIYRLSVTDGSAITINDEWVKITGMQLKTNTTTGDGRNAISVTTVGTGTFWFSKNLIQCARSGGTNVRGINIADSTATAYIWNNIVYGSGTPTVGIRQYNQAATYTYNNTVSGFTNGMEAPTTGTVTAINNLFSGNTNASNGAGTYAAGTGYNATDLSTMNYTVTGGSVGDRLSQTFSFVGAGDFHLTSTDGGARDYGTTNPGSGLYSDDVDGATRTGTWDIGADEYTAGGGPAPSNVIFPRGRLRW